MGTRVTALAELREHTIVSELAKADVCIDFSVPEAVLDHVKEACAASVPIVIGTTGWDEQIDEVRALVESSRGAALYAPNFSLGVALFRQLLHMAQELLPDYACAGIETHHEQKKDAPSGTAKAISADLGIEFSSVRCGSVIGTHHVLFDSPEETITLTHAAKNRDGFALGAINAAEWIVGHTGWLTLDDMLYGAYHTV